LRKNDFLKNTQGKLKSKARLYEGAGLSCGGQKMLGSKKTNST